MEKLKIVILVCGNIAAGKSSLAASLQKIYPDFDLINVDKDHYRVNSQWGKSFQTEREAEEWVKHFVYVDPNNLILQTTGYGDFWKQIIFDLENGKAQKNIRLLKVRINSDYETQSKRYRSRKTPSLLPFKTSFEESFHKIEPFVRNFKPNYELNCDFDLEKPFDGLLDVIFKGDLESENYSKIPYDFASLKEDKSTFEGYLKWAFKTHV